MVNDDERCRRCGSKLDADGKCDDCDHVWTDEEIAEHEGAWGELWLDIWTQR